MNKERSDKNTRFINVFSLLIATFSLLTFNAFAKQVLPPLKIELLTQVSENKKVYIHTSYKYVEGFGQVSANGLVYLLKNKEISNAYIIDTPWSNVDTQLLIDWIKSEGYDLKASFSTHSHDDRSAGIPLLNSLDIATYASKKTNNLLAKANKIPASNHIEDLNFILVAGEIEVYYPGGGHAIDNHIVYLPALKMLFGGCMVRSAESKNLGYVGEAVISEWPDSIAKVIQRYPHSHWVVPGHGKVGDKTLLTHTSSLAIKANKAK